MTRAFSMTAGVCVALMAMSGAEVILRGQMSAPAKALVDTEHAFAQASVAKGTRDAYLEFLADDSLLFRPGPVPGKMFTRNRPAPPGKLVWAPTFAEVASSEDVGYTSGPFEFRKGEMTEAPASYGHYISVWRKQKDGQWRLEVNLTVSHEKFTTAVADVKEVATPPAGSSGAKPSGEKAPQAAAPAAAPTAKPGDAKPTTTPPAATKPAAAPTSGAAQTPPAAAAPAAPLSPAKQAEQALKDVDAAFSKLVADQGSLKAFQATVADGIRLYRDGMLPVIGKAAIEKVPPVSFGSSWQPAHARVAASGDIGYTTGVITLGTPAPGSQPQPHYYLRIWRKDKSGAWKIEADMVN